MKASIVDLRYKMNDVLKALSRNERVTIYYRGKTSGVIVPAGKTEVNEKKVCEHPFFGMHSQQKTSVAKKMEGLRGGRYKDIKNVV